MHFSNYPGWYAYIDNLKLTYKVTARIQILSRLGKTVSRCNVGTHGSAENGSGVAVKTAGDIYSNNRAGGIIYCRNNLREMPLYLSLKTCPKECVYDGKARIETQRSSIRFV